MIEKIKEKLRSFKNRTKGHKKATSFFMAAILVIGCFLVWLNFTRGGWLMQKSFEKSFHGTTEPREIKVYSGEYLIDDYEGYYIIEQYHGYIVLINQETNERTDIYGASVIVNSPDEEPSYIKKEIE